MERAGNTWPHTGVRASAVHDLRLLSHPDRLGISDAVCATPLPPHHDHREKAVNPPVPGTRGARLGQANVHLALFLLLLAGRSARYKTSAQRFAQGAKAARRPSSPS